MAINLKHYELCFLILHFLDFEMTSKCIESLLNAFANKSVFIVVVDNGSTNDSGKLLEKKYINNDSVYIIFNSFNLGFAKGNNVGYSWIRNNIDCDFLCVNNNDIIIKQEDVLDLLKKEYEKTNFAVLGPDIVSLSGKHQNPLFLKALSFDEIIKYKESLEITRKRFFMHYIRENIEKIINKENKEKSYNSECEKIEYMHNPVLHGACYFFSKKYMLNNEHLFNPRTFMYFEENILHYECLKKGLDMIYFPEIRVEHLEDISTKAFIKNSYSREKWILKESIKSVSIMIDIMKEENTSGNNDYS